MWKPMFKCIWVQRDVIKYRKGDQYSNADNDNGNYDEDIFLNIVLSSSLLNLTQDHKFCKAYSWLYQTPVFES